MKSLLNSAALGAVLALAACAQDSSDSSTFTAAAPSSSTATSGQLGTSLADTSAARDEAAGMALDEAEPAAGPADSEVLTTDRAESPDATGMQQMATADDASGQTGDRASGTAADSDMMASGDTMEDMGADPSGTYAAGEGTADAATSSADSQSQLAALPPMSDEDFATFAARGDATELQAAQLAVTRATTPEVRAFAQHMIEQHSNSSVKLKSIAASKGLSLPSAPGGNGQAMLDQLRSAEGADFDRAYMESQVKAHSQMLVLMQSQAQNGQDPQLKAFAAEATPMVQGHLEEAQQIRNGLGA